MCLPSSVKKASISDVKPRHFRTVPLSVMAMSLLSCSVISLRSGEQPPPLPLQHVLGVGAAGHFYFVDREAADGGEGGFHDGEDAVVEVFTGGLVAAL